MKDAISHVRRRDGLLEGYRVIPAESLVVSKEIGLSAQNVLRDDRAATRSAEAVVVITGQRCAAEIVVKRVCVEIIVEIIFVSAAMPGIRAALGDHLNLCAGGAIEVRGLVGGIYLELFNAVERRGHDAGRTAANLIGNDTTGRITREARGVDLHAAVHVIRVLAAIEHERALVNDRTGHATIGRDTGLQGYESGCVPANRRQVLQEVAANGVAHRSVQGLQLGAVGDRNFDCLRHRANF